MSLLMGSMSSFVAFYIDICIMYRESLLHDVHVGRKCKGKIKSMKSGTSAVILNFRISLLCMPLAMYM